MGYRQHCSLTVRGFLSSARYPAGYVGLFTHDDGRAMSPEEARNALFDELARGHEVIPFGPACEGFDHSGGGCPGHSDPSPKPSLQQNEENVS